ncbi:AraC family transcriptional regulator of arabinose operon [Kitasatospora sp. MAA19]|uniref:helix-turn-helix domain-containing protein n=1 Tax=Kitasatospora sp. MAA19 TaxID=3035090 RepID=UPI002474CBDC|nr:helix-turn-helix domain-containing protein [Kitasatospora sp. MAA19]MDH6708410.1 AraC family transcriptional regulator of arabinose operon [Kitasatospora sp. MAA19]
MTADDMSVPAAELVILGHFDQSSGYAVRRSQGSPSWLLMWTRDGAGLVEQAGVVARAEPGHLVVLGPEQAQYYRTAPGENRWRFWWVHFQPRPAWLRRLAPYALGAGCHVVPGAGSERMEQALLRACGDARWSGHALPASPSRPVRPVVAESPEARELVLNAVEEVLLLATVAARRPVLGDPRVRQVQALIAAEPGAPHSVASLARAVALSPSRLAHLFTLEVRLTPMQAVREARMRQAAQLLAATDLSIGRIATASGFASQFHFSRTFSREVGMSPREYRAGLRASGG